MSSKQSIPGTTSVVNGSDDYVRTDKIILDRGDLSRYDQRERNGAMNRLVENATVETLVHPAKGKLLFDSNEIRRAVDTYAEEFSLSVEDPLLRFGQRIPGNCSGLSMRLDKIAKHVVVTLEPAWYSWAQRMKRVSRLTD